MKTLTKKTVNDNNSPTIFKAFIQIILLNCYYVSGTVLCVVIKF